MSIYQKSTSSGILNLDEKNTQWRNAVNGEKLALGNDQTKTKSKSNNDNMNKLASNRREKRSIKNHHNVKSSRLIKSLLNNKHRT